MPAGAGRDVVSKTTELGSIPGAGAGSCERSPSSFAPTKSECDSRRLHRSSGQGPAVLCNDVGPARYRRGALVRGCRPDGQTSGLQPDETCSIHVARSDAANRIVTRLECHSSIEGALPSGRSGTPAPSGGRGLQTRVDACDSRRRLPALVRADPGVGLLSPMARFDSGRAHPHVLTTPRQAGDVPSSLSWGIHAPGSDPGRLGSTPSREAPRAPAGSGLRFAIPTALGSTPRLEAGDRRLPTISALVAADPPARLRPLLPRFDSEQARRGKGRLSSQPSFIRSARPVQHGSRSHAATHGGRRGP
jgi:hypothetical protein